MKRAIISDIHANLEALQAVLDDIRRQGIREIYCLGDIIGYGPNPCECLDLVIQHARLTILGNHDQAALFDPDGFNPVALQAIYWTRDQLEASKSPPAMVNKRWDFLGELPHSHTEGDFMYVHGSPRRPPIGINEYVFPEDVYNQRKMTDLFALFDHYCLQGHTHIPGVFTQREFLTPEDLEYVYQLGSESVMINVGSVGQPRDGDPRACYVVLEPPRVSFRRVEYPVEETIRKIYEVRALDNMLGDRLRSGR